MPEIRNCPRCGKIFNYIGRPICPRCVQAEEDEFKIVKDYVDDNSNATMAEVADATGISVDKIMRFLRDERLEVTGENSGFILECESCSRAIKTGRFCDHCKNELNNGIRKEFGLDRKARVEDSTAKKVEKDRMFTATRRRS